MGKRVTVPQAAEITGLSEHALRVGIKMGKYPYIKVGLGSGKILIDIDLLEQYLLQEALDNVKPVEEIEVVNYGKLRRIEE